MSDFDAIVIGSGFGGAITSCRLAEAGYRVLVLERGRRWDPTNFPRTPQDPWVFDPNNPQARNGWFDFRIFRHMTVVQGAGVGGGSLVYANISIPAKEATFHAGWPAEITFDELKPYYASVGQMLNVKPVPQTQWPERTKLMRDAANSAGFGDKFEPLELAVSFDEDWNYDLPNPHAVARSKTFTNAQGVKQGTCVHLGNCDIGCDVAARNTLDLNYLALAEKHDAEIRPLHLVDAIAPDAAGYRVSYHRIEAGALVPGSATARLVIVAAGSLGSTELLLRCRDQHATLPAIGARLGIGWSSNGDFLTPAFHPFRRVDPTHGPTITAAINLLDHGADGQDVFVEDGGFPDVLEAFMRRATASPPTDPQARAIVESLRPLLSANLLVEHVMPWFAQARDAADGRLFLKDGRLDLDWNIAGSRQTMDAVVHMHQRLAHATQGMALTPLTWTVSHDLVTPHPLGGCSVGTTVADGVVDHKGEVFGFRNLFVADGAIVPKAIGLNPSRTIGALAERIARIIVDEGR
jgi:cholesterol oxidase